MFFSSISGVWLITGSCLGGGAAVGSADLLLIILQKGVQDSLDSPCQTDHGHMDPKLCPASLTLFITLEKSLCLAEMLFVRAHVCVCVFVCEY